MTDFTIEQLEALKEGITPGPWEVNRSEIGVREIVDGEVDLRYLTTWEGEFDNDNDAELAAAAPSLVDALIAEKQAYAELRRKLDETLSWWGKSSERLSSRGMEELAAVSRSRTAQLARILEAGNE